MSPLAQAALYGFAATVPVALNWHANSRVRDRYIDALGISVMLLMLWALSNLLAAINTPPENMILFPALDLVGLYVAANASVARFRRWKILLSMAFLLQLAVHAAFWLGHSHTSGGVSLTRYVLWLNGLFLAQLLCVAWPGGIYGLRRVLSWLSDRRHSHSPAGVGPA